jgi:anti-sigma regulatory factor (Ser/Thr protein kinase)
MKAACAKTFPADVKYLDVAQDFVRSVMQEAEVACDTINAIELVAEEVFINIALYAYKGSESGGDVTVRCAVERGCLSLEFSDNGVFFNPLKQKDPDVTLGVEEREPGGLGLFMVKKIMDVVEYRRESGKNILRMCKYLT